MTFAPNRPRSHVLATLISPICTYEYEYVNRVGCCWYHNWRTTDNDNIDGISPLKQSACKIDNVMRHNASGVCAVSVCACVGLP